MILKMVRRSLFYDDKYIKSEGLIKNVLKETESRNVSIVYDNTVNGKWILQGDLPIWRRCTWAYIVRSFNAVNWHSSTGQWIRSVPVAMQKSKTRSVILVEKGFSRTFIGPSQWKQDRLDSLPGDGGPNCKTEKKR